MKRITIILFIVGLLFEFAAFFGDQAANLPFVMRLVAPKYSQAQAGIDTLSTKKILEPHDRGFSVISEILIDQLREQNDPKQLDEISIRGFSMGNALLSFGQDRVREVIPIDVTLSNGQTRHWSLDSLTVEVDALQNTKLFAYALIIFLLGVLIQSIGLILQYKEENRQKRLSKLQIEKSH